MGGKVGFEGGEAHPGGGVDGGGEAGATRKCGQYIGEARAAVGQNFIMQHAHGAVACGVPQAATGRAGVVLRAPATAAMPTEVALAGGVLA